MAVQLPMLSPRARLDSQTKPDPFEPQPPGYAPGSRAPRAAQPLDSSKNKLAKDASGTAVSAAAGTNTATVGPNTNNQNPKGGWQKSHPLEGDGLLSSLYFHLWKKNKNFQSCPHVRVPETVIYEHNFPRAWYGYDQKSKELFKKVGRDLDTSSIYAAFSRVPKVPHSSEEVDICAQYIYSNADPEDYSRTTTSVQFLTPQDLFHFLNERKQRPDGILQKFLMPKSKCNSQIQAIWSPRVCIIQRRENINPITDKYIPLDHRCVTFDGPTHFTEEGFCAPRTKDQVREACEAIVNHFFSTDHKSITRMVCYFKVDRNDQLWLLWASSLRVQSSRRDSNRAPLNLAPSFVAPDLASDDQQSPKTDELREKLIETDLRQYALSNDRSFAMSVAGGTPPTATPRVNSRKGVSPRTRGYYTRTPPSASMHSTQQNANSQHHGHHHQPSPPRHEPTEPDVPRPSVSDDWWKVHPAIRTQYERITADATILEHSIMDVLYRVYSHVIKGFRSPLIVSPPPDVVALLPPPDVRRLMQALSFSFHEDDVDEKDDGSEAVPNFVMVALTRPKSYLYEAARTFIAEYREGRLQGLQENVPILIGKGSPGTTAQLPPIQHSPVSAREEEEPTDDEQMSPKRRSDKHQEMCQSPPE